MYESYIPDTQKGLRKTRVSMAASLSGSLRETQAMRATGNGRKRSYEPMQAFDATLSPDSDAVIYAGAYALKGN